MGYVGRMIHAHCVGKRKYATREEAAAVRPDQKTYRCSLCFQFHLSNTPKGKQKRRPM